MDDEERERGAPGAGRGEVTVPGWMVKGLAPLVVGLLGWGAAMMWDARDAARDMARDVAYLRERVEQLAQDRYTGTQATAALALRDLRLAALEAEVARLRESYGGPTVTSGRRR